MINNIPKEHKRKSGIYSITNSANKMIYIGSATDFSNRFKNHKHLLSNNKHFNRHLQNICNKYSIDIFSFNFIEECEKDNLLKLEAKHFNLITNSFLLNINKEPSSRYGVKCSEETKQKMRDVKRQFSSEHLQKIITSNKNRKWTKAMRKNQSLKMLGKSQSTETKEKRKQALYKPVLSFDKDNNPISEYASITAANEATGINKGHIGNCCNGKRKTAGKLIWKFKTKNIL